MGTAKGRKKMLECYIKANENIRVLASAEAEIQLSISDSVIILPAFITAMRSFSQEKDLFIVSFICCSLTYFILATI